MKGGLQNMNSRTETRLREIRRRAHRKRKRRELYALSGLSLLTVMLITGIGTMLYQTDPGVVSVSQGYGAILLRQGASAYVVVAIGAFVLGVLLSVLCIRARREARIAHPSHTEESEESQ